MIFKKLERKYVKPEGKLLHWVPIGGGFILALIFLALITTGSTKVPTEWLVAASLFAFGAAFNQFVTWLEYEDWEEGATAILVVIGVGYTICLISALIGHLGTMFWCFAVAGGPMVAGSWLRYARRRAQERNEARKEALKRLDGKT